MISMYRREATYCCITRKVIYLLYVGLEHVLHLRYFSEVKTNQAQKQQLFCRRSGKKERYNLFCASKKGKTYVSALKAPPRNGGTPTASGAESVVYRHTRYQIGIPPLRQTSRVNIQRGSLPLADRTQPYMPNSICQPTDFYLTADRKSTPQVKLLFMICISCSESTTFPLSGPCPPQEKFFVVTMSQLSPRIQQSRKKSETCCDE